MADLASLWQGFAALAVAVPQAVVPLRAWVRGWASGLDALARSLGAPRPESIPAPQTWRTDVGSLASEAIGSETLDNIRAWEAWYAPVAARLDLPPSTLLGETAPANAALSWRSLRDVITLRQWAAYITGEASRWNDALSSAQRLPATLGDRVRGAEQAVRAWWTVRNARGSLQPPRPPVPPPPPPPPPDTTPPARGGAGPLLAVLAAVAAVAALRRRRR